MKHTKIVILIMVYLFLNNYPVFSQNIENENRTIFLFVRENISDILNKIPENQEKLFGFKNRTEFESVTIGNAIQLYTISNSIVNKHLIWRVPIIVNGEYRALVTVQKDNNDYKTGDFGATVLANDIQQIIIKNPDKVILGILRIYTINSDFLIVKNDKEDIYIPLTSAEIYLASQRAKEKSFYTLSEIKNLLKQQP